MRDQKSNVECELLLGEAEWGMRQRLRAVALELGRMHGQAFADAFLEGHELRSWTDALDVSKAELEQTVMEVGPSASAVRAKLGK